MANSAPNGQSYPPLGPMDGSGYDFLTESVAEDNGDDGAGLPSDGFFAADGHHPNAQLAFSDLTTAVNSAILNRPPTPLLSTTFPIVNTQFSALQLYFTSTEGSSAVTITLNYGDSTTDVSHFTVPDWFQPGSAGLSRVRRAVEPEPLQQAGRVTTTRKAPRSTARRWS